MFQLELFEKTYAEQYTQEGFTFFAPKVGDVTFLNGQSEPVHRWFRLTPSYSPELVRHLLHDLQCNRDSLLCDPFLGKGTTIIEAKKLGYKAIGIEINPLLKLASEYALTWEVSSENFANHFLNMEKDISRLFQETKKLSIEEAAEQFNLTIPPIHNVFRWWKKDVLKELLLIRKLVWEIQDPKIKRLYWLALCSSALDCANVHRNHPTISFDDDHDREIDVLADFGENVRVLINDIAALPPQHQWGEVKVISGDSTKLSTFVKSEVDRVITSPPYPNRFSYVHTTRPQLFFMEIFSNAAESGDLDCAEIGGTWGKATSMIQEGEIVPNENIADIMASLVNELRPKNNLMCNYAVKYFNMMDEHIQELKNISTRTFRGAYVVGNSRLSDVEIFTDILLAKIFERNGFIVDNILVLRKRGGRKKLYETAVCVRR